MNRFKKNRWLTVLVTLLIFIVIVIGSLPTILSTRWAKNQLLSQVNQSIPGQISIEELSLNWISGQKLRGVILRDLDNRQVLSIEEIETQASLWQLLTRQSKLGKTHLKEFEATLIVDSEGHSNLAQAIDSSALTLQKDTPSTTIQLRHVNGEVNLFAENQPLSLFLKGSTNYNETEGSFDISLFLKNQHAKDWQELSIEAENLFKSESESKALLHAQIHHFPVALIDLGVSINHPEYKTLFSSVLGNEIDLDVTKEISSDGLLFSMTTQSPTMQGSLKGHIDPMGLQITDAGQFTLQFIPEKMNKLLGNGLQLKTPTTMIIELTSLHLPFALLDSSQPVTDCSLSIEFKSFLNPTTLELSNNATPVHIKQASIIAKGADCDKNIIFDVLLEAQELEEPFSIMLQSKVDKSLLFSRNVPTKNEEITASMQIQHLPLHIFAFAPELVENLGANLNADIEINKVTLKDEFLVHFNASTAQSSIQKGVLKVKVNESKTLQSNIDLIEYASSEPVGKIRLRNMEFLGREKEPHQFDWTFKALISLLDEKNALSPLLSSEEYIECKGRLGFSQDKSLVEIPTFNIKIAGSALQAQVDGSLSGNQKLTITQPINIQYLATPTLLESVLSAKNQQLPKLKSPATVNLKINPFECNLHSFTLNVLKLKGQLAINEILFEEESGHIPTFKNLVMNWNIDAPSNLIMSDLRGATIAKGSQKPTDLSMNVKAENWTSNNKLQLDKIKAEIKMDLFAFPVAFVNPWFVGIDVPLLLGDSVDIELKTLLDLNEKSQGYWDMFVDSSKLHVKARLKIDQAVTLYESNKPTTEISYIVTPEIYQYLKTLSGTTDKHYIKEPVTLTAQLLNLNIPLQNSMPVLGSSVINAKLFSTIINLRENSFEIPMKLDSTIETSNLGEKCSFKLSLQSDNKSAISLDTVVSQLFDHKGQFKSFLTSNFEGHLSMQNFSPFLLRTLILFDAKAQSQLEAVFGKTFDASADFKLNQQNGPVSLNIKGDNGSLDFDGKFTKGILTLSKAFKWQIKVTPQLGESLLKEYMPLFSSVIDSDSPIVLEIDPNGFSAPLIPFNLEKIVLGKGKFELGKIRFKNEGDLKNILSLIKPIEENQLTIWFTSQYFNLNKGILHLKRLDMLVANRYELATWGDLDLPNEKLNMIIGLSEQTLRYAFNLQGLDSKYMFQIPISGQSGKIQVDKKKVTGRISSLIAQTNGGTTGKLIGGFLDIALADNLDPTPPPPMTTPLPWAGQFKQTNPSPNPTEDPSQDDGSKKKHKNKDAMKGLEKEAGKLLNNLLR